MFPSVNKDKSNQCSHSRRDVRDSRGNFNNRACFKYHTRAFTHVVGQKEEIFIGPHCWDCFFDQPFHCFVLIVLLSWKIVVTMSILLLFGRISTSVSFRTLLENL